MEQRSPEWHKARQKRVTASVTGAILGVSPYMTRADAMRNMVRDAIGAPREFTGNVATEYGVHHEPGALIDYAMETGHAVEAVGFIPFEDWAGISPDGLIGEDGGIEVKCPFSLRQAVKPVTFKALAEQPHYEAQVQFSLFVTGRAWWDFVQYCPADMRIERIYPDHAWRDENLPKLRQFHAEFLDELANNADEHLAPKRAEIDTPEAHLMMAEWDELKEQIARAQERQRDLLDSIVDMSGGTNALFAGRKLTLVEREGAVAYARVVKDHLPQLDLAKYRGKPARFWRLG